MKRNGTSNKCTVVKKIFLVIKWKKNMKIAFWNDIKSFLNLCMNSLECDLNILSCKKSICV